MEAQSGLSRAATGNTIANKSVFPREGGRALSTSENTSVFAATGYDVADLPLESARKGPVPVDVRAPCAGSSPRRRDLPPRLATECGGRFLPVTGETGRAKAITRGLGAEGTPSSRLHRNSGPLPRVPPWSRGTRCAEVSASLRSITETPR